MYENDIIYGLFHVRMSIGSSVWNIILIISGILEVTVSCFFLSKVRVHLKSQSPSICSRIYWRSHVGAKRKVMSTGSLSSTKFLHQMRFEPLYILGKSIIIVLSFKIYRLSSILYLDWYIRYEMAKDPVHISIQSKWSVHWIT